MVQLLDKKILLGVSASIAAYKSALLARLLRKAGAEVKVVMTPAATEFITPLTLSTLTGNPALSRYTKGDQGEWNNHVELGLWADLFILAPASANTLSKMAHGACDNLLMATYLSLRCPCMVCPAMDLDMYAHPSTQKNLELLEGYGHIIVDAEEGALASGLEGKGRMAEPENIVQAVVRHFKPRHAPKPLSGKTALVTAGPTREYLDPVRFLTNGSTGKMGYAIAACLQELGASVTLITGPTNLPIPKGVDSINVMSAADMYEAVKELFPTTDISVFSAAVSDYQPETKSHIKMKKSDSDLSIPMKRTPDIAARMGRLKKAGQITIGFALETHEEEENAKGKLQRKNFDLVVLNSLQDKGAGFGHDTNKVTFVSKNGLEHEPLQSKKEVAEKLCQKIAHLALGDNHG